MTVMVYHNNILAADSAAYHHEDGLVSYVDKIAIVRQKGTGMQAAVGGIGDSVDVARLMKYWESNCSRKYWPKKFRAKDSALWIMLGRDRLEILDAYSDGAPSWLKFNFMVGGIGRCFAHGAMYLDRDPVKAVQAAIDGSDSCGGDVLACKWSKKKGFTMRRWAMQRTWCRT